MNERYLICKQCKEFDNTLKMCRVCHCFMPVKTRLPGAECPKGLWSAETTKEQINAN